MGGELNLCCVFILLRFKYLQLSIIVILLDIPDIFCLSIPALENESKSGQGKSDKSGGGGKSGKRYSTSIKDDNDAPAPGPWTNDGNITPRLPYLPPAMTTNVLPMDTLTSCIVNGMGKSDKSLWYMCLATTMTCLAT